MPSRRKGALSGALDVVAYPSECLWVFSTSQLGVHNQAANSKELARICPFPARTGKRLSAKGSEVIRLETCRHQATCPALGLHRKRVLSFLFKGCLFAVFLIFLLFLLAFGPQVYHASAFAILLWKERVCATFGRIFPQLAPTDRLFPPSTKRRP